MNQWILGRLSGIDPPQILQGRMTSSPTWQIKGERALD